MSKNKLLTVILRFIGATALLAVVAVFIPFSWMAATHRWLGLGEMPTAPIVEYLARSLSAIYAFLGALCLLLATDLERYRPLVRFLGTAFALLGVIFTAVDLMAGMPTWWTVIEGPPGVIVGGLMYAFAGADGSKPPSS